MSVIQLEGVKTPKSLQTTNPKHRKVLTEKETEFFKELINADLKNYNGQVEILRDELGKNNGDMSVAGNTNEHGTATSALHLNSVLCENNTRVIRGFLRALDRIEKGMYGICPGCVKENHPEIDFNQPNVIGKNLTKIRKNPKNFIPILRLIAQKGAKTCIKHKEFNKN